MHSTLKAAFGSKLALEDEGYESGSENFNIPTPLRRTTKIHHVSSVENMSFDPDPVTPCNTGTRQPHHRPVCRCLIFSSSEDDDDTPTDKFPSPDQIPPGCLLMTIFPLEHVHHPRWRRHGRGFPNITAQWWTLEYGRNPWQTSMYSWTFLTTWTMPIPMSICKLPY